MICKESDMEKLTQVLRLLGEETRLRLLILLSQHPLNVSELTTILGMAQSGVSRHLGHLRKMGLLQEQREGVWTYYQLARPEALDPELRMLWGYLQEQLSALNDPYNDRVRLAEVLRQREVGGSGLNERLLEPGQSWQAWSRLLTMLLSQLPSSRPALGISEAGLDVLDLGCGDGTLTVEMARFARRVVGVDFNPDTLAAARQRIDRLGFRNVTLLAENVNELPLESESVDVIFFSQSLHHLDDPKSGLREAFRVLRPGGCVFVMELAAHREQWVLEKLNHKWLGFERDNLLSLMQDTGLAELQSELLPLRREELFQVMLASGIKS